MQNAQPIRLSAARFGIVGILNTVIDFGITNALFFLLQPSTTTQLALIAVAAFSAAAANSYLLNSRWSFSASESLKHAVSVTVLAFAIVVREGFLGGLKPIVRCASNTVRQLVADAVQLRYWSCPFVN